MHRENATNPSLVSTPKSAIVAQRHYLTGNATLACAILVPETNGNKR